MVPFLSYSGYRFAWAIAKKEVKKQVKQEDFSATNKILLQKRDGLRHLSQNDLYAPPYSARMKTTRGEGKMKKPKR